MMIERTARNANGDEWRNMCVVGGTYVGTTTKSNDVIALSFQLEFVSQKSTKQQRLHRVVLVLLAIPVRLRVSHPPGYPERSQFFHRPGVACFPRHGMRGDLELGDAI